MEFMVDRMGSEQRRRLTDEEVESSEINGLGAPMRHHTRSENSHMTVNTSAAACVAEISFTTMSAERSYAIQLHRLYSAYRREAIHTYCEVNVTSSRCVMGCPC